MSARPHPVQKSPESGPIPQYISRNRRVGTGIAALLATSLFATAIYQPHDGASAATPQKINAGEKSPDKGKHSFEKLKQELASTYVHGSVKLIKAKITGVTPMLSDRPYDREIVSAHIDYKVGKNSKYLSFGGNVLQPQERVIDSHNHTRPGVVNWAEYPSNGDINMEVQLGPYSTNKKASRKYRLYLAAMSAKGANGHPIAAEFYAGTVSISGKNNSLDSVSVTHEDIPSVHFIYPKTPTSLDNPNGVDPANG